MRLPPLRQTISQPRTSVQLQPKPKTPFKTALPGLSWIAALAAVACAFFGTGQITTASAAGLSISGGSSAANTTTQGGVQSNQGAQKGGAGGCTLTVPSNPLTAVGLATPYLLASASGSVDCHEATNAQAAFVQAAALDPATGQIAIYNPLVIDRGTQPAAAPVVPALPSGAIVALWFGSNANGLTLQGATQNTLTSARCVNGLGQSAFGQMAYCNAPAFFSMANQLIAAGKLTIPALGTARDGLACPTVRDFSVVDQDQSDNVTTSYLVTQDGRLAQNTGANLAALAGSATLANGSDNRLLAVALDGALGCSPWRAPDLASPGAMIPALPLNELQAASYQSSPVALVPGADLMTLVSGHTNLEKQNLYRVGVDQLAVGSASQATHDQITYCRDLLSVAPARLQRDRAWTSVAASLDSATANSLFTFLAARLSFTLGSDGLNCTGLLHTANPVTLTQVGGVVTDASFTALQGQGPNAQAGA
jgi:hypothetical protein